MEEQVSDFKLRVEENVRHINELNIVKNKLTSENTETSHMLEEAESKVRCRQSLMEGLPKSWTAWLQISVILSTSGLET